MLSFDELASMEDRAALIGMKAESLVRLRQAGFTVPDGFVVTPDETGSLTPGQLSARIDQDTAYAVRSSGTNEDLGNLSFAGQYDTYLNVRGVEDVCQAVHDCAQSLSNPRVTAYAGRTGIDMSGARMAVVVQRMVDAEISGVAFSIDAVGGMDKQILIEAVPGLGEQLVSGAVTPHRYIYDWYESRLVEDSPGLLGPAEVAKLARIVLDIQILYGFPVDVEWAITGETVHVLQARPITTISYRRIPDEWTTADFRDGGVSAAACKTLMASLYGLVFTPSFLDSVKTLKLFPKDKNMSFYEVFFARPYWCLTVEKDCFAKLPGFVERELDEDMGIVPTYEGDGMVTRTTVKTLWNGLTSMRAITRHIRAMEETAESRKDELLRRFSEIDGLDLEGKSADELLGIWVKFIRNDYFTSECTYFSYIFCTMILSTLVKDRVKKHTPDTQMMDLMTGLEDLSHMRPIYEMWDMSRHGRTDAEFADFIARYKHHSLHELDVSFPDWDETPEVVRGMIDEFATLDDSHDPRTLGAQQRQKYLDRLAQLPQKLHKDVERLRRFLWWREEFRDVSTISYYCVRKLTLALGRAWADDGLLVDADDIFFLSTDEIESKSTHLVDRNKQYFQSFVNFANPNELGNRHVMRQTHLDGTQILKGVACAGHSVTAVARVVKDIHDADRIAPGEILVTTCTDPAWTAIFSRIGGVITETGGMLSHAAVVSREYGLACILMVRGATQVIHDGDLITMDCDTGQIYHAGS